jgi:hypothetical protein
MSAPHGRRGIALLLVTAAALAVGSASAATVMIWAGPTDVKRYSAEVSAALVCGQRTVAGPVHGGRRGSLRCGDAHTLEGLRTA